MKSRRRSAHRALRERTTVRGMWQTVVWTSQARPKPKAASHRCCSAKGNRSLKLSTQPRRFNEHTRLRSTDTRGPWQRISFEPNTEPQATRVLYITKSDLIGCKGFTETGEESEGGRTFILMDSSYKQLSSKMIKTSLDMNLIFGCSKQWHHTHPSVSSEARDEGTA